MMPGVHIAATFAFLAGLIHFYIFSLESLHSFDNPKIWKIFGVGPGGRQGRRAVGLQPGLLQPFLAITAVIGSGLPAVAKAGTDQMILGAGADGMSAGLDVPGVPWCCQLRRQSRGRADPGLCPLLAVAYTWARPDSRRRLSSQVG